MLTAEINIEIGDVDRARWAVVRAVRSYIQEEYDVKVSVKEIEQKLDELHTLTCKGGD